MRVMLGCGFFMGLPKSKAQIGWGRYWVVPAVGVVWLPTALGWLGFCLRGACCLVAYGVGLSLISYWSISVAPVRGGHLLLFAGRRKEK
jgi:hypothetical protein